MPCASRGGKYDTISAHQPRRLALLISSRPGATGHGGHHELATSIQISTASTYLAISNTSNSIYQHLLVSSSIYQYVPVSSNIYQYISLLTVSTSIQQYLPVSRSIYQYLPIYIYPYLAIPASLYQYPPVSTSIYSLQV